MVLDVVSGQNIRRSKEWWNSALKYHSDYYADLAQQRSVVADQIGEALQGAVRPFSFENWKRCIRWQWSRQPLSSVGSLINDPGGRFNIGDIDPARFPRFPAIYLACDGETALEEATQPVPDNNHGLSPLELSLATKDSLCLLSVSGSLDSVIDLHSERLLAPFLEIIKEFTIAPHLISTAKKLGLPKPELIDDTGKLIRTLLLPEWRADAVAFDVPVSSQLFGRMVMDAGIDGILFPSKHTGRPCLAIFPYCFKDSTSWVSLDAPPPHKSVITRLDEKTWRALSTP